MGLLDTLESPEMGLALGLLNAAGPSRMPVSLGQAFGQGIQGMQEARSKSEAFKSAEIERKVKQAQLDAIQRKLATQKMLGEALMSGNSAPAQDVGPSPSTLQAFGLPPSSPTPAPQVSYADKLIAAAMKAGDVEAYQEAQKMKIEERKLAPKFATDVRVVMKNGVPTAVQMADDGTVREMSGMSPAEKLHFADNGQLTGIGINQYTGKVVSPGIQKVQDPNSVASNAVTMRGQNMTDARAREANSLPTFDAGSGSWLYKPTQAMPQGASVPVQGYQPKLGEAAQKQVVGIANVKSAIDEYVTALKDWSNGKMVSPDSRALMGTKYNNLMLQAKEAYNLGVLNGPDLQIMEKIITNPLDPKSAFVSKNAMETQAKELKRLMTKMEAGVRGKGQAEDPLGIR